MNSMRVTIAQREIPIRIIELDTANISGSKSTACGESFAAGRPRFQGE
jgi:hypothetical protein